MAASSLHCESFFRTYAGYTEMRPLLPTDLYSGHQNCDFYEHPDVSGALALTKLRVLGMSLSPGSPPVPSWVQARICLSTASWARRSWEEG